MDIFTERFNLLLQESNERQDIIAQKANLSKQSITEIKKGRSYPSIQTLRILCKVLNTTSDYLIGLEDESGRRMYNYGNNVENNYGTVNQYSKEKKRS